MHKHATFLRPLKTDSGLSTYDLHCFSILRLISKQLTPKGLTNYTVLLRDLFTNLFSILCFLLSPHVLSKPVKS